MNYVIKLSSVSYRVNSAGKVYFEMNTKYETRATYLTYQGFVRFHQLYNLDGLFVLVDLQRDLRQSGIVVLLGDCVVSAQQALQRNISIV